MRRPAQAASLGGVRVVVDASNAEVVALQANASVVWSLTGLGADELDDPADAEHFGIAVVEAMSAGAVPVVVDKGGLTEIVTGRGFLCRSVAEIARRTAEVFAMPPADRARARRAARDFARGVSAERFRHRYADLVHRGVMPRLWRTLRVLVASRTLRVPARSRLVAALVEPRADVVLPLVVKINLLMLPCDWRLHVFHGASNGRFFRTALRDVAGVVYSRVDDDYDSLLKSAWFWNELDADHVLIFHADTLLFRPGAHDLVGQHYVAAPWTRDDPVYAGRAALPRHVAVGNGRLSIRSTRAMIAVIQARRNASRHDEPEDVFFARHLAALGYPPATPRQAAAFALRVEHPDHADLTPVGLHLASAFGDDPKRRLPLAYLRDLIANLRGGPSSSGLADRRACSADS